MRKILIALGLTAYCFANARTMSLDEFSKAISKDVKIRADRSSALQGMADFRKKVQFSQAKNERLFYPTGKNILYAFGGADVFFPSVLFPDFDNLIIIGREDILEIPTTDDRLGWYSEQADNAHKQLLSWSYIETKSGGKAITASIGMGTAIAASMSALGYQLQNVIYYSGILCQEDGSNCQPYAIPNLKAYQAKNYMIIGVDISFTKKDDPRVRHVIYYDQDLADEPSQYQDLSFFRYLNQVKFDTTYYKAASYLPQAEGFSKINQVALKAKFVVQSDCGLPYSFFQNKDWQINFYGRYLSKPPLFGAGTQRNLYGDFVSAINKGAVDNLTYGFDFSLAYDYAGREAGPHKFNLMIARKNYL